MLSGVISWTAVGLAAAASTGLLLSRDWRWDLAFLAVQYLAVASLVAQHWPAGMAAAKLVTGWMATAALGMTLLAGPQHEVSAERFWPQGRSFRLFMAGLVLVAVAAVTPQIENAMVGIGTPVIAGAILLIGMGLLQLGTGSEIPRVIFGLLTVLAGFEIFYAAVEGSILVAGLLAMVNLGLGLIGAYLLTAGPPEEEA